MFKWRRAMGKESFHNLVKKLEEEFANDPETMEQGASLIARLLPHYMSSDKYPKYFQFWEQHGVHITPNHFYQPIPDTRTLKEHLWTHLSELAGVDMNIEAQAELLLKVFPQFKLEYDKFPLGPTNVPYEFYLNNGCFDGLDALVLYCMVRHFKPRKMIEIGSGFSTRVSAQAALLNGNTELTAIEPYPSEILIKGFPGLSRLYREKIENMDIAMFKGLEENDILFVDTSHVVKCGGDVNVIYLEIIPRLNKGVIVHIHDIFFPREYPKEWIFEMQRFWTEQYLLQSFLAFNSEFEVLFSNSFIPYKYFNEVKSVFHNSPCGGSSFWMRRKRHQS